MGLVEALFYSLVAFLLVPKNREEVPFKQFGFDVEQLVLIFSEFGLYEASAVELFKTVMCITDYDYSVAKGWCHELEDFNMGYLEDPNSKYTRWDILYAEATI